MPDARDVISNQPVLSSNPSTSFGDGKLPQRVFDWRLWLLIILLLIGYPVFVIWKLTPYYGGLWPIVDIVLAVFSVITGLQLLNRVPTALRNAKLFLVLYLFSAIFAVNWVDVLNNDWSGISLFLYKLLRISPILLLIVFSRRGRLIFPDNPIQKWRPWPLLRRYFVHNLIGQVFVYCTIALLVTAVITTSPPSPSDGSSKRDANQEQASNSWLEAHPNNLKQLMDKPTGVRPVLESVSTTTTPLNAKAIFDQKSPAIVVIYTTRGFGAGFLVTADGVVVTSQHVLDGANDAVVMMKSGQLFSINSILKCDKNLDYCLFKIDTKDVPYLILGDPSTVAVGDEIVVIGHPYGYSYSLSNGLISQIQDYDKAGTLFQFTAPASPGNSGGPVFNSYGQVIGISNSILVPNDAQNLNFATSVSSLKGAIESK